jgi:hypothetical protein
MAVTQPFSAMPAAGGEERAVENISIFSFILI